ncbi:unnamed protein product [Amoebophrya sp. A25]|nr:unnamed protein product [Amoebophrya sp. A25]|eukprot:GSA25T00021948001.1
MDQHNPWKAELCRCVEHYADADADAQGGAQAFLTPKQMACKFSHGYGELRQFGESLLASYLLSSFSSPQVLAPIITPLYHVYKQQPAGREVDAVVLVENNARYLAERVTARILQERFGSGGERQLSRWREGVPTDRERHLYLEGEPISDEELSQLFSLMLDGSTAEETSQNWSQTLDNFLESITTDAKCSASSSSGDQQDSEAFEATEAAFPNMELFKGQFRQQLEAFKKCPQLLFKFVDEKKQPLRATGYIQGPNVAAASSSRGHHGAGTSSYGLHQAAASPTGDDQLHPIANLPTTREEGNLWAAQQEVQGLEATATEAMQWQQGMYGTPSGGMEQPFDGNYFYYSNYYYAGPPATTLHVPGFGSGFGISQQACQSPSVLWTYGDAASSDEQQMTIMTPFLQQRPEANAQQANAQQAIVQEQANAQQQTQQLMEQEPQEEKVVEQLEVEPQPFLQETEDERLKRLKTGDVEDEHKLWEWWQIQEHLNMSQGPPQEKMIEVDQELQPLQDTADERLARLKNDADDDDEWKQMQANMIGQAAQTRQHLPQSAHLYQQQQPPQMQYLQPVRAVPSCMMTQGRTVLTPIFAQLVPAEQMQQPIGQGRVRKAEAVTNHAARVELENKKVFPHSHDWRSNEPRWREERGNRETPLAKTEQQDVPPPPEPVEVRERKHSVPHVLREEHEDGGLVPLLPTHRLSYFHKIVPCKYMLSPGTGFGCKHQFHPEDCAHAHTPEEMDVGNLFKTRACQSAMCEQLAGGPDEAVLSHQQMKCSHYHKALDQRFCGDRLLAHWLRCVATCPDYIEEAVIRCIRTVITRIAA